MLLFAISGISISEVVFTRHKFINRIWLGLAIGLLMLTWLPSLLALLIGFTLLAQILSAVVAFLLLIVSALIQLHRYGKFSLPFLGKYNCETSSYHVGRDWLVLIWMLPILILFFALLDSHVLYKGVDGGLYVGQVTYGDLAMHLGFITSIAEQSAFPPQYSIFPGHPLNYPFLCETSAASLLQIGASLRQAYNFTAGYAFMLVLFGVYGFFRQWLKKPSRAALATILFFFGGGFGFFYFFDLSKAGGILSSLIDTNSQTVSQALLEDFYHTPTNIPALGLRWVNPIVDMLLPQRATLFGWAFLFPCLYLLHRFAFEKKRADLIPLAVIAGLVPMIHTHSFLALGVISAVYCVTDIIAVRFDRKRIVQWLAYALITCAIAAPQLFLFTFKQASESGLVKVHLNWANNADSYLWFYIKNLGLIFLLMPFAFLVLPKRDKKIYLGALFLWLLAELVQFQPNEYDNNKLLFVWYAFTCGLVAKFLLSIKDRISFWIRRKTTSESRRRSYQLCIAFLSIALVCYDLFKILTDHKEGYLLRPGTAMTLCFVGGLLLWLCIAACRGSKLKPAALLRFGFPFCLSVWLIVSMGRLWLIQYQNDAYEWNKAGVWISLLLGFFGLIAFAVEIVMDRIENRPKSKGNGVPIAITVASYLLIFTMTVSSAMTILRELKSGHEYQVYSRDEAELAEEIQTVTEPDTVILANSFHWNIITPLTGRSIVTGTGTFLYYHGITEFQEREAQVLRMYTDPRNSLDLFDTYGIQYVLIGNAEKNNYNRPDRNYRIDYDFFRTYGEVVAQNEAGTLYKISLQNVSSADS